MGSSPNVKMGWSGGRFESRSRNRLANVSLGQPFAERPVIGRGDRRAMAGINVDIETTQVTIWPCDCSATMSVCGRRADVAVLGWV